ANLAPAYSNPASNVYGDNYLAYNKKKTGFLLGLEIPFMPIDSTMYLETFGIQTRYYNISGNLVGFGGKVGYQYFTYPFFGSRAYLSYKYMGGSLKDSSVEFKTQSVLFNADLLLDIPFNFVNPNSGFGIVLGAVLGGQQYYDGIYNLPFNFVIGLNMGLNVSIAAKHRIEFLTQWLVPMPNNVELAEHGKSKLGTTGTRYTAESFIPHNISFSIGYTRNF
ncbi:outer membrane beta-barrel protein, partial [Helicobacter sp. MIT 14-3879]|uniref:outer membrane beta-barrel protein n=1 Tax=Helicobacter sp. MIT 14-3879 TaxID=2040649 RepID=UPI000E1F0920